jgi:signal transduction histidine kinase
MLKNDGFVHTTGNDLKIIRQNAFSLLTLVNQLLDYRKIEYEKHLLRASENDLVAYVEAIVDNFRQHAQS